MKAGRQKTTLVLIVILYTCAFTFINIHWSWIPKHIESKVWSADKSYRDIRQEKNRTSAIHSDSYFNIIKRHNGSFAPSFSISNYSVPVSSLDEYNEFEYQQFSIAKPYFARDFDREFFENHDPSKDLMDPVPFKRRRGVVQVSRNGYYSFPFDCGWPSDYSKMKHRPKQPSEHYKQLCPLIAPESHTFQHFLDGLVPKIIQARDIILHPDMKVLMEPPRQSDKDMIVNLLQRIGIKESKIVWRKQTYYTADYMVATCITPPLHPALWRTARKLYGAADKLLVPIQDSYIIVLTRALSHNGGRKLINKQEVVSFLERRYGKQRVVLFKGGYSLTESLALFGKARLLIGVHGGAIYNQNFASKETIILELMPSTESGYVGFAHTIFWSMARLIGQDYWRMFVKSESSVHNVILDIDALNHTLNFIHKHSPLS